MSTEESITPKEWVIAAATGVVASTAGYLTLRNTIYHDEITTYNRLATQIVYLKEAIAQKNVAIDRLESAHDKAEDAGLPGFVIPYTELHHNIKQDEAKLTALEVQSEPYDHVPTVLSWESAGIATAAILAVLGGRRVAKKRKSAQANAQTNEKGHLS